MKARSMEGIEHDEDSACTGSDSEEDLSEDDEGKQAQEAASFDGAAPSTLALLQAWEGFGQTVQQGASSQRLHTKRSTEAPKVPLSAAEKVLEAAPRRRGRTGNQPITEHREDGSCDCCADPGKSEMVFSRFCLLLTSAPHLVEKCVHSLCMLTDRRRLLRTVLSTWRQCISGSSSLS